MTNTTTLNRVERACAELRRDGHHVTFTAVAARTGLGRSTLYRNPTIRAVIEGHRHRTATSGTVAGRSQIEDRYRPRAGPLAATAGQREVSLR